MHVIWLRPYFCFCSLSVRLLTHYHHRLKPYESNSFSSKFMAYLLTKIQHKQQRNAYPMACSAYLGSFLARAAYIPSETLRYAFPKFYLIILTFFYREVVECILNWALAYANSHPNPTADAVVHGLFYSMSQSLYYIFCFHHKALRSVGDVDALKQGLRRITESKLNPLKVR